MRTILTLVILISCSSPALASAQGFVTCSGPDCNFCSLVEMANKIIEFLITMTIIIATLMLAYAGFKMVFSQGDPGSLAKAKEYMLNVFIGVLLMLAAWTIVDTLIKVLLKDDAQFGVWNKMQSCGNQFPAGKAKDVFVPVGSHENNLGINMDSYSDGSLISESGINGAPGRAIPVSVGSLGSYAGAQFDQGIIDKVKYIDENFGLQVSGGYRTPERNRQVNGSATSFHLTGQAADFVGSMTEMQKAKSWADQNGAVETLIHNAGSGTHLHVAWR